MYDIFYITKLPKEYPDAQQVSSVAEAQQLSRTRFCWILDGYNIYKSNKFNPLWEPAPWEAEQIHVWPSQHQQHGGTVLAPKVDNGQTNYHNEKIPRIRVTKIIWLDHGNDGLHPSRSDVTRIRFIGDYLDVLKRVVSKYEDEPYLWITSSICNYVDFKFTWHPSEWQQDMLHVFPSNEQKFGDTFFINVKKFKEQMDQLELLEWYDTICFQNIVVPRIQMPVYLHHYDNQVDAVKSMTFEKIKGPGMNDPLVLFSTTAEFDDKKVPTINLWRKETKTIVPLSKSGNITIVPRDAMGAVQTQIYDYPYIDKTQRDTFTDKPLDIIFLSNSESNAEKHYQHLINSLPTSTLVSRVENINGRLAAYRECAQKAKTDWFFVVYAKLQVNQDFDWKWQPDRLQSPKHYIFYAYNPITKDTYGHMAMIAFNRNLVLEHPGTGLDFSMEQAHEVVPVLSGTAEYANDPWMEWRTTFREVLKLLATDDMEAVHRLEQWSKADSKCTRKGYMAAVLYYHEVNGNPEKIRLSYEWDWLRKYYEKSTS